jgi:hypothetical protein
LMLSNIEFFGSIVKSTSCGFMIEMWFVSIDKHHFLIYLISQHLESISANSWDMKISHNKLHNTAQQNWTKQNKRKKENTESGEKFTTDVRGFSLLDWAPQWFHQHQKPQWQL